MEFNDFINTPPYSLNKDDKNKILTQKFKDLTLFHYNNSVEYKSIINSKSINIEDIHGYSEIPFLPVRLFKEFNLKSIREDEIFKTMTSSGTSGQQVSKIFLDRETSINQTKTLTKIVSSYIGSKRLPMIILDTSAVIKDRKMFSARGAGIIGFQMFAYDKIYALDENMNIDIGKIEEFLKKHEGETILLFGFTFMIWQHFYKEIIKLSHKLDLSNGILIHGGGWKKLQGEAVTNEEFKKSLYHACMIEKVYNYYGMVEQTGTIYMECEYGHLHTSIFSDIIVRDPFDFSVAPIGKKGIIEVLSILPKSYPGHAILTEDEGIILGEDDCPCGRYGKYFKVIGRLKNAEIRGCSDTYEDKFR